MGLGRLVPISIALSLIISALGGALFLVSELFPAVPTFLWFLGYTLLVLGVMLAAIYTNITRRIRRIQEKIEERGAEVALSPGKTLTLEKLEVAVNQWSTKQSRLVEELESREEFRREYIGNVSHELKTPIFNIQGYILTLLDGAIDDPKVATKFLKRASKSVERMTSLIKDMDALSKVETGQYDIQQEAIPLRLLVDDTLQGIESYASKNDAQIQVEYFTEESIKVMCDSKRIEQVLDNLLVNAIKYSEKPANVKVKVDDLETKVQISVIDKGFGIPEKDLGRVFERFYRVDKARSRDAGGSGLGLSIVKHIIDKHNQTIVVSSVEGQGTIFKFTLSKA